MIVVVNLDPFGAREGLCIVPAALRLPEAFTARDLLGERAYRWRIGRNYVHLPPGGAHVITIEAAA